MRQVTRVAILVLGLLPFVGMVARADDAKVGDEAFKNRDYQTALRLLPPPALQGDIGAQIDLGAMYFAGHGVPQDYREAAKWFRAAAQQGNVGGQTDLGILYATGSGVRQDDVQAYMWFSLAASENISSAAEYRDHVAERMTADQIQVARDAATQCKASNFKDCGEQ